MPKNKWKNKREWKLHTRRASVRAAAHSDRDDLEAAHRLMRRERWDEAREILEALERRFPQRQDVLEAFLEVHFQLGDMRAYQSTCQQLVKLRPNDPELVLGLAGAYLSNVRPALAIRTFQRFVDRWPDEPKADEIRQEISHLRGLLSDFLASAGLTDGDGVELGAMHEEIQCCLENSEFAQARSVAERLLQRKPDFVPALNNMGEAYFREGQTEQAISIARRVLEIAPDNFHALGNLARYLFFSGQMQEARAWVERLKTIVSDRDDIWLKKAETLNYLGDDQGVLDALRGAEDGGISKASPHDGAMIYHFAAVAAMRMGQEKEARRYWSESLRLVPGFEWARENLDDLKRPVWERHAPWGFPFAYWIPAALFREMASRLKRPARAGDDHGLVQAAKRFLEEHPELVSLLPMLLERGDKNAREFALRLASVAETPETLAALQEFALSRHGPDEMRMQAAQTLSRLKKLPSGPVRMWVKGEWRELLLMGWEIHGEPTDEHPPGVVELVGEAMEAIRAGDGVRGESLLKQALEIRPNAPDLLNNLAAAYSVQKREEEADALIRQVHAQHPDYLFARTNLAQICAQDGEIEKAKELLKPLFSRQRLHFTEFAALCMAQIEVAIADHQLDGAVSWYDMWKRIDPDHPDLKRWEGLSYASKVRRFLGG